MVNQFVHLKTKSHYSILESSIKIDDLIAKAVEDNMPAIALTDTNNLFGAMEFTKKALEKKIKPILGANILVEWNEESHNVKTLYNITCLIMNEQGWQNLSILVSTIYKNLQEKVINILYFTVCSYIFLFYAIFSYIFNRFPPLSTQRIFQQRA